MTLISTSEMAALRDLAESGMVSEVTILRRAVTQTDDGQVTSWVADTTTVPGWLYETTGVGAVIGVIAGGLGVAEQFWLRVPVGTVIESGDRVQVSTIEYAVQHTNVDNTYLPWLVCALRHIE